MIKNAFIACLVVLLSGHAAAEVVTAERLNVRAIPSGTAPIIDQLSRGDIVRVFQVQSGWARIGGPHEDRWVSASYLRDEVAAVDIKPVSGQHTGKPLDVPSDPVAQYFVLENTGSGSMRTIVTKRVGASGTSYSKRLFDCDNATTKYLGHGDSLAEMHGSKPHQGLSPIIGKSIAYYLGLEACGKPVETKTLVTDATPSSENQSYPSSSSATAESEDSPFAAMILIVFIVGIYFLPTIVATQRNTAAVGGVVVLNLFLGWTFLGWVVSLAWAVAGRRKDLA